ncbi:carboxymuconolactone decarboxylase family protein [Aureimonas altamirensis]|uniref:carboxymuconolactone decarboxylase family protein n=1 Tax=Aureimonas altamirensis TaxID=370622 RepID=UPI001E3EA2C0|nr:carboxymuconolactone decarboxylase family protein [Aureimonas altamirensis]UHD46414.1 carboxymuconolactone decarboxylase family protein [Aureimonas altamirensis]
MKAAILMMGMAAFATTAEASDSKSSFPRMAPPLVRETVLPLAIYTDEVLFGSVWARPELSPRDRSLITVAALVAGSHANQTRGHTNRGLDNGIEPEAFGEILAHLTTFTGPDSSRAVLPVMKEVFAERDLDASSLDEAMAALPEAGADLWQRPGLTQRDRSIVTVAAMIAGTRPDELAGHLDRAMDEGLTEAEAGEIVTHLAFYTGWPNAMTAVPVLRAVFDERGEASGG